MSRDAVLNRVRAGTEADAVVDLPSLPAPGAFDDLVAVFTERARAVGVHVEVVESMEEAAARAAAWCAERNARRIAVWERPDLTPVIDRVSASGPQTLLPGTPIETLALADAGITAADWGIADTGSLVLAAGPRQPRLTSLLPAAHLAILQAHQIVADLPALFAQCGAMPSALTFITGPSRSADIGLVPVLGAHGPTEVSVLVVAGKRKTL